METIIHSFSYSLDFLREQVEDLTLQQMQAQPESFRNHPTWTIGHWAFSCRAIGSKIGPNPWLAGDWAAKYAIGSNPIADAQHDAEKKHCSKRLPTYKTGDRQPYSN